jgi:hypothetical protein
VHEAQARALLGRAEGKASPPPPRR